MDWICPLLFFALAGALGWILYLLSQLDDKNGWLDRTQGEIDWVKQNCPKEWVVITTQMSQRYH